MKRLLYATLLCSLPYLASSQAVVTAVFDADLPGGLPKGIEIYLTADVVDMSRLGVGSANNGDGTDGVEFTFPAMVADSGTYVYLASDSASFRDFFGFNADFITLAMAINGDDAIEIFWDSMVIDVFGEIDVDGTGQPWEYMDGWAARKPMTGPDAPDFVLQNWNFSGINALDGETTNGAAVIPVPLQSYTDTTMAGPDVTVIAQNLMFIPRDITIDIGQTVRWTNVEMFETHNVNGQQSTFPCNPVSFYSGEAALGPWDFDVTFNAPGFYEYQCDPHVFYGMAGTVTVIDPNAPSYPVYDIDEVHTEDVSGNADSTNVRCELQGVVHGPNYRPNGLQFTIIDVEESVGINVFKAGMDCYQVTEGDLISIKGMITQFNGLTEIEPETRIEVLSTGNALMDPVHVETPLGEAMESTMAMISSAQVDSIVSTGASGWNMFVTNPQSVSYLVRLDGDIFADVSMYEGEVLDVTGIVGQFDTEEPYTEGYQLFPRSADDIDLSLSAVDLPQSAIRLYPNPTSGIVLLDGDLEIIRVDIYTAWGARVGSDTEVDRQIDVSQLAGGVYLLLVETTEGQWGGKFIKH